MLYDWHYVFALAALIDLGLGASPGTSTPKCTVETFQHLLPANARVETVDVVPKGGTYGEGMANVAYPTQPTNLPSLCAVIFNVISSPVSAYRVGVFLPTDTWTGRVITVGNGGFNGGINWVDMAGPAKMGFAVFSTDMGHNSTASDSAWAFNNPEGKTDWGWRATHGAATLGRKLAEGFYAKKSKHSYYSGCSTGGRQGLKEMQMSPETFDGVLVGAPAWWPARLNTYAVKIGLYNLPLTDPKHIDISLLPDIAKEVVRQCDAIDGVKDGIISNPYRCKLDFSAFSCKVANMSLCLSDAQIQTMKNVYSNYIDSKTGQYLWGGLLISAEYESWNLIGYESTSPYGIGYVRNFLLNNATWSIYEYNDNILHLAEKIDPGQASANKIDLSDFKNRGGKMIMYHGLSDGLVPTKGSDFYYESVLRTMGRRETPNFFRYFHIPGMTHCAGTVVDAPWAIGGSYQAPLLSTSAWSVPGFEDSSHDALLSLVDWVEKGKPVDSIIATTWNTPFNVSSGVKRQRPLCPYPKVAVYNRHGDVNQASSWICRL